MSIDKSSAVRSRSEQMWRASAATSAIAMVSGIIGSVGFLVKMPQFSIPSMLLALGGGAALVVLLVSGLRSRSVLSITAFFFSAFLVLSCVWLNQQIYLQTGKSFEPFVGDKIFALTVGLIAPPILWVGLVAILATGIAPLVQYLLLSTEVRQVLPVQEPWSTLVFVMVGLGVYVFRVRSYEIQLKAARLEERALLLQEFAHLLINAQHLANTPMQTLLNSMSILKAKNPESEQLLEVMGHALGGIWRVVQLFSYCDSHINWEEKNIPVSLEDFEKRLKDLIKKTT